MATVSDEFSNINNWTVDAGDWSSTGTAAKLTNSEGRMRYTATGPATNDVRVTAEIDSYSLSNGMEGGAAARMSASAATFYQGCWEQASGTNQKRVYKSVNGTRTQLASSDEATFVDGQTVGIECSGTSIRGRFNGSQWTEVTDSAITSGGWGLRGKATGGGSRHWTWERWEANDLAAGTPIPVLQHNYRRRRGA